MFKFTTYLRPIAFVSAFAMIIACTEDGSSPFGGLTSDGSETTENATGQQPTMKAINPLNFKAKAIRDTLIAGGTKTADLNAFYAQRGYEPLWVGTKGASKRRLFFNAAGNSSIYGISSARYQIEALRSALSNASSPADKANADIATTRSFVKFANEMSSGVLNPRSLGGGMKEKPIKRSATEILIGFANGNSSNFIKALPPRHPDYARLVKEKARLQSAGATAQLQTVIVNLERLRWMNKNRGARHIWVNLPEYTAAIVDNGQNTLKTRVVIGKASKFQTPEFSDTMTHMVINPTWNVPRSIAGKEYLPILKKNPGYLKSKHMRLVTASGAAVNPSTVNFSQYTASNFPYLIKQNPNPGNALGLVKFMFPNKYNIYLHDTPSKSLFNKNARAFSHGCVRVKDPFNFAYVLLSRQAGDPKAFFQSKLATKKEQYVNLTQSIPVHIVYQTAVPSVDGSVRYLSDVYGRDGRVMAALRKAGAVN